MGALRKAELAYPHQPYIEELHDFFAAQRLHYGAPLDVIQLVDRLDDPGLFHEDMRTLVRSILAREEGGIPRSDLLAIIAVAVGGPMVYRSAEQLRQPLSRLLDFIDGVLRKTPPPASTTRGELIEFPVTSVTKLDEPAPAPRARVWLTAIPRNAVRSLRPIAKPSPSFRNAILVVVGAAVLVLLLIFLLHPSGSPVVVSNHSPAGYFAAKPSAYGEAFVPDFTPFVRYAESAPTAFAPVQDDSAATLDSTAAESELLASTADTSAPALPVFEPEQQAPLSLELEQPTAPSSLSLNLSPEFSGTPAQAQPTADPAQPAAAPVESAPQPAAVDPQQAAGI